MKKIILSLLLVIPFIGCEKDNDEEDYRNPFTGLYNFTTIKSTTSICYDSSPKCINGWEVLKCDTVHYSSNVLKDDTDKLLIQFGDGIIGIDDKGDTIHKALSPVVSMNGALTLNGYPSGGHNKFEGFYSGYDTIKISLQFGFLIGGYDKYEIQGIKSK